LQSPLPIVLEDNHLLVVNKPAGLVTQGALPHEPSVHSEMCRFLKMREQKPGNVYLGIVSRLDASTSGLLMLAKTSKAAARLSEQIRQHTVSKHYLAALAARPPGLTQQWSLWTDHVVKDDAQHRMVLAKENSGEAQQARLQIRELSLEPAQAPSKVLVYVRLLTGRKHQIRLQCSTRGAPVLGDEKYGASRWSGRGIALHAASLRFSHPVKRESIALALPPPAEWNRLNLRLPTEAELLYWMASEEEEQRNEVQEPS
jgi:23S rRNA pseudouridine1911/1915/1917 synthase